MSQSAGLPAPKRYRALFLSDLHLGSHGCRADKLLAFLHAHEAEHIYLVGDIFDFCRPRAAHWSALHDAVLDLLSQRQQQGVTIVRLPGNHDPLSASRDDPRVNRIAPTAGPVVHQGADRRRYLVTHGDCCDLWLGRSHRMSQLGSVIEGVLRRVAGGRDQPRQTAHASSGLVAGIVRQANRLMTWGGLIERRLVGLAKRHGADGIICGHLHQPALHQRHGVVYANCGDWVDNLCAIAEDSCGIFSLIDWAGRPLVQPAGVGWSVPVAVSDIEHSENGIA